MYMYMYLLCMHVGVFVAYMCMCMCTLWSMAFVQIVYSRIILNVNVVADTLCMHVYVVCLCYFCTHADTCIIILS